MPSVHAYFNKKNALVAKDQADGLQRGKVENSRRGQAAAPVILMVSGGADSMALLHMVATEPLDLGDGAGLVRIAQERLHVLHVNHLLRGVDADADQHFVQETCDSLDIPYTVLRVDVAKLAQERDGNVEEIGRRVRYDAARELAQKLCAEQGVSRQKAKILTAHTADDRAETFMMNVMRGSGMSGLASIPRHRGLIYRPLLDCTHDQLKDWLKARGLDWHEDATNTDTHYLRAYMRHNVLPLLKARNPLLVQTVCKIADLMTDEDDYLEAKAARKLRHITLRKSESSLVLDALKLSSTDVVIARRVVRIVARQLIPEAWLEFRHVDAVLEAVAAGVGVANLPQNLEARVRLGTVAFSFTGAARSAVGAAAAVTARSAVGAAAAGADSGETAGTSPAAATFGEHLAVPGTLELADGRVLSARILPVEHGFDVVSYATAHSQEWLGESVLLDAQACGVDPVHGGSLWVSGPEAGDTMQPLGMHGQSKKISDLLGEAGVPVESRSMMPIVRTNIRGHVVWVAGIRPDERVKCTQDTKQLLELNIYSGHKPFERSQ
ncbi:tRNA(Ile)-lysidine synthetase [Atopobium sp. BS2]|uniref:tRNA lysidine(34) synthetase TilS n=1 Tax=Atopobium sp. BS2 TaxID=936550 RepID=UPI00044DC5E0|nr:tRNA lysidine(34) synthetase TilS [Atopobium sp. BS2]EWC91330.1 tRNA(Ile)-lysidine synthetase [Atopobium sp. BS2]